MKRLVFVLMFAVLASIFFVLFSRPSFAHSVGLSSGRYVAHGTSVDVELSFARGEVLTECPALDQDHDTEISPSELAKNSDCFDLAHKESVRADGMACEAAPVDASLTESDGVLFRVHYTCATRPSRYQVDDTWLSAFPSNHKHVARGEGKTTRDHVLDLKNHVFEMEPPDPISENAPHAEEKKEAPRSFVGLGIEHILTGYDHLAFLLGLVLIPLGVSKKTSRALFFAVTAFSVGHSVSLALAVLRVLTPSSRVIEPLIALSIAFVGLENTFAKRVGPRWIVTLIFGLVHGFGFADSARSVLPAGLGVPLFTFNLGVEIGQIMALVPMLALVYALEKKAVLTASARRTANLALFLFGAILCIARVAVP